MRTILLSLLVAGTPAAATAAPTALILDDIGWRVERERTGAPRLTLSRGSTSSNGLLLDRPLADGQPLAAALRRSTAGPVAFQLDPEAGTLSCSGTVAAGVGHGRCRFVSRPAYEAGLATRAIPLKDRTQLFELAVVDARLARADGLARAGFRMRNGSDLVAATALDVTGDYARGLLDAGLTVRSFNDLIACRALKIDASWVRGFTADGYRFDARRAVAMKATGVTPDYARAIAAGGAR